MMYSDTYQTLFLPIPKCASNSMGQLLERWYNFHVVGEYHSPEVPLDKRSYFAFTVVRNPYERERSFFRYSQQGRHPKYYPQVKNWTFARWVQWRRDHIQEQPARYRLTQWQYIQAVPLSVQAYKLETFAHTRPFTTLANHLPGIATLPLPQANATERGHEEYTEGMAAWVQDYFAEDFTHFGYNTEET